MHFFKSFIYYCLGILIFSSLLVGCKHTEKIASPKKLKHLSVGRVMKLVNDNSLNYETLSVKKVSLTFSNDDKSISIKGSYKIRRDSVIQLFAQKLSIPVGKIEVTRDSFKVVNYLGQELMIGKNDYLNKILNIDLDYEALQAVLSNKIFSFKQDSRDREFKDFVCQVEDGMYKIASLRDRKFRKLSANEEKLQRYRNHQDETHLIKQDFFIDPDSFVVRRMILTDMDTRENMNFEFSHFEKVMSQWFPGSINIVVSGTKKVALSMDLSKVSLNENENFGFSVSPKYRKKVIE